MVKQKRRFTPEITLGAMVGSLEDSGCNGIVRITCQDGTVVVEWD